MKCPICEGAGRIPVDYAVVSNDGKIPCPSCEASGRIKGNLRLWRELRIVASKHSNGVDWIKQHAKGE